MPHPDPHLARRRSRAARAARALTRLADEPTTHDLDPVVAEHLGVAWEALHVLVARTAAAALDAGRVTP